MRAAALEIAEHRTENASGLYQAGWLAVLRPDGRPDDYNLAVRRLEAACQIVVDDPERLAQYSRALALAYYRAGQPARAIEIDRQTRPSRARDIPPRRRHPASRRSTSPLRHGQPATRRQPAARAALEQLRKLVQTDSWANDQEAQMFFREAEGVVGGPQ